MQLFTMVSVTTHVAVIAILATVSAVLAVTLPDSDVHKSLREVQDLLHRLNNRFEDLEKRVAGLETQPAKTKGDKQMMNQMSTGRTKRDVGSDIPASGLPSPLRPSTCKEGRPGRDGKDGRDGQDGPMGPPGRDGLAIEELEKMFQRVLGHKSNEQTTPAQELTRRSDTGAVYVRWGRTQCPSHSQLIYDGFVAGSYFTHKGGGSEKLCLPKDPQFEQTRRGFQSGGHIYGAEFEVRGFNPFSTANTRGNSVQDANAVCAVCLAISRPSHVMIPAYKTCPTGWTKEYSGYLMSSHIAHFKSSYDCVDIAPEASDSGVGNQNGALFYIVESVCGGSLPCPPYASGAELTCVVCTK